MSPETPVRVNGVSKERLEALVKTACVLLTEGMREVDVDQLHRLVKADTKPAIESLSNLAGTGLPSAMLLYERFFERPFAGHRNSVTELIGDSLDSAIEEVLSKAGVFERRNALKESMVSIKPRISSFPACRWACNNVPEMGMSSVPPR